MTGDEYKAALRVLGLTHTQAAKALGVTKRTSVTYGKSDKVPQAVAMALELLYLKQVLYPHQDHSTPASGR